MGMKHLQGVEPPIRNAATGTAALHVSTRRPKSKSLSSDGNPIFLGHMPSQRTRSRNVPLNKRTFVAR